MAEGKIYVSNKFDIIITARSANKFMDGIHSVLYPICSKYTDPSVKIHNHSSIIISALKTALTDVKP